MPCYSPLQAFPGRELTKNGKRKMVFDVRYAHRDEPQMLPCGQCIGCRLERSRQWAMRCVLESSLYEKNCFITLTYAPEYLPSDYGLHHKDWQDFMKRYRKKFGAGIRFYMCGEYGEQFGRPHFHACIFNHDLPDKVMFKRENGIPLYRSDMLEKIWGLGNVSVGSMTFESAGYVARYSTKVHRGENEAMINNFTCLETGELIMRKQEYGVPSNRPGLASDWFKKFKTDVYPKDFVTLNGVKMKPPKYFDYLFEKFDDPEVLSLIKDRRREKCNTTSFFDDNTPERLAVKEYCKFRDFGLLVRNLDNDL